MPFAERRIIKMKFPYFNDFLETLTEEKIESFNKYRVPVQLTLDENGCIKASSLPDIVNGITVHCEQTSLNLLRAYHEWLLQELEQDF